MADHDEVPVGSANWDLSALEDMVSTGVPAGIATLEGNVPPDVIPDRPLEEGLLARHGYCCCCYCCKRYLSQTVDAVDGVACPEDDRTESRNLFPVSCRARVLHQRVPVLVDMPDVVGLSSSRDESTAGRQDVLVPHWNCICALARDHDSMVLGTSYEVRLYGLPYPVDSLVGTAGIVGYNERDSPGMVDIVS